MNASSGCRSRCTVVSSHRANRSSTCTARSSATSTASRPRGRIPWNRCERVRASAVPEPEATDDVIDLLLAQHARIEELFVLAAGAEGEPRRAAFDELVHLLAVHETAEEEVRSEEASCRERV